MYLCVCCLMNSASTQWEPPSKDLGKVLVSWLEKWLKRFLWCPD